MLNTPDDKRKALAEILAAHPGNSCTVQCARIRAALSRFSLTTFEAMRHLDIYDPRARVLQLRHAGESITTWKRWLNLMLTKSAVGLAQ